MSRAQVVPTSVIRLLPVNNSRSIGRSCARPDQTETCARSSEDQRDLGAQHPSAGVAGADRVVEGAELIGAAQILNQWLGLYSAPGEWPWTYFFLLVLMLVFALHRYGRSLGLDAIIVSRMISRPNDARLGRALVVVT